MPWPWASDSGKDDDNRETASSTLSSLSSTRKDRPVSWSDKLNATNWDRELTQTAIVSVLLTGTSLFFIGLYKSWLRRVPNVDHIKPQQYRKRSLFGRVTSVGDGDNFRLYHTPGGRLLGWGLLRRVPTEKAQLRERTVCRRRPAKSLLPRLIVQLWVRCYADQVKVDPRPSRRRRRPRMCALRTPGSAVQRYGAQLAYIHDPE